MYTLRAHENHDGRDPATVRVSLGPHHRPARPGLRQRAWVREDTEAQTAQGLLDLVASSNVG